MRSSRSYARTCLPVVAVAVALLLPGCSKDSEPTAVACRTVRQVDGVTKVTIVGKNIQFDVKCLNIDPGQLELTFDNQDSGVAHNLHITGTGVNEKTELEPGKTTQKLTVLLTMPGQYTFACDPHGSMAGKIIVADPTTTETTTS
ncbi:MAG: cupredoxin domain-containing protein [Aquihabitans sp.]